MTYKFLGIIENLYRFSYVY